MIVVLCEIDCVAEEMFYYIEYVSPACDELPWS